MKLRFPLRLLVGLTATATTLAQDHPAATKPRLSARLGDEIRATLPAYSPPPAPTGVDAEPTGRDAAGTPGVLELPKFSITERVEPRLDPDQMISQAALAWKQKQAYLAALEQESSLTRVLNSFHVPLFAPSVATRAKEHYRAEKTRQLATTISAIATADPETAKTLRKELFNAIDRPSLGRK